MLLLYGLQNNLRIMMMRPGDILGRIFFILSQKSIIGSSEFIHGAHGGHGSSEIIHGAHGGQGFFIHGGHVFFSSYARNLGGNVL